MTLNWQIEPLGPWNRPLTEDRRSRYTFRAAWPSTLQLLETELRLLDVRGAVALRVDVVAGEIRRDGMLRADARVNSPAVAISFDGRYGPLTYATDVYDYWQANVRAIALGLEALRAVDRYGVSRSGEQYAGWRAIEPRRPDGFATLDDAMRWLERVVDAVGANWAPKELLRTATTLLHPDRTGGDRTGWDRLDQARQLIERSLRR